MDLSPGNPQWSHDATIDRPTLDSLNIKKDQSSRWQRIAKVPEEVRAEHIAQLRKTGEVTSASVLKLERKLRPRKSMTTSASVEP